MDPWMYRVTAAKLKGGEVVRNGLHCDTLARDREIVDLLADETIGRIVITRMEKPE